MLSPSQVKASTRQENAEGAKDGRTNVHTGTIAT